MNDKYPYDEPNLEENNSVESQEDQEQEEAPVKLSKIKAGFVFVAFLIVVMIVIMTIRGCSVSREVNSSQEVQTQETQQTQEANTITSTGEEDSKKSDNVAVEEGSESSGVDNTNEANISDSSTDSEVQSNKVKQPEITENTSSANTGMDLTENTSSVNTGMDLQEVSEPQLSEAITTTAVVSSKSIFLSKEGSYVYQVDFLVITDEEGNYSTLSYYCPKTTYDALAQGDSVNVEYQTDSTGNISVSSVSR